MNYLIRGDGVTAYLTGENQVISLPHMYTKISSS